MNSINKTFYLRHNEPHAPALITTQQSISWAEFQNRIHIRQNALTNIGLKSGDKCAIFSAPSVDYIETLFAMWTLGIIAVPLNTRLLHPHISKMLKSINCFKIITDDNKLDIHGIQHFKFDDFIFNHHRVLSAHQALNLDSPATVIFTSGSTGQSKACLHSVGNHVYSALGSNENINLNADDSWLLSLPLYHVAGIAVLFRCLVAGAAVAVPSSDKSITENIGKMRPTHISLVAAQLQQVLSETEAISALKSAKAILLGGSAIPPSLVQQALDVNLPIYKSYGCTEMSSQITTTRPADSFEHLCTSGSLLKHRELKIADDGEIMVRGKTLFQGYVDGEHVVTPVDEHGWYHTLDLGRFHDNGYLTVLGRKDNMFISGGENIFPEEIERALEELDYVEQAIVVPVHDHKFGQRPAAFLKIKPDTSISGLPLELLKLKLPSYKIPDHFFDWPGQDGLKPNRRRLQVQAEQLLNG